MRVRKLRQKDTGFICYRPIGPWWGDYKIENGKRILLPFDYVIKHDFELLGEGSQDEMEESPVI